MENKSIKVLLVDNEFEDTCMIHKDLSKVRDVLSDKRE